MNTVTLIGFVILIATMAIGWSLSVFERRLSRHTHAREAMALANCERDELRARRKAQQFQSVVDLTERRAAK